MAVRLVDGKTFNVPSDLRVVSKKKQLIASRISVNTLPLSSSYKTNSLREETLLQYVEHFRRQFVQLYPHHRPLLLCPQNECGIRKFVCTSIQPTLLPFSHSYDLAACAQLVSELCHYLPLDDPMTLPDYLPATNSILTVRAGDCLDLSTLLCSLLCGSGYNAYVVSGTAPKWLCEADVSAVRCPLLRDEALEAKKAQEEAEKKEEEEKKRNRYLALVPHLPQHHSKFIQQKEQDRQRQEDQREKERLHAQRVALQATMIDPLKSRRAHAWVMVMKGRREMNEDVFIEPSTGFIYPVHSATNPYLSVESIWNHNNYWVNVQSSTTTDKDKGLPSASKILTKASASSATATEESASPLQHLRLDLSNLDDWEYVLEKRPEELIRIKSTVTGITSSGGLGTATGNRQQRNASEFDSDDSTIHRHNNTHHEEEKEQISDNNDTDTRHTNAQTSALQILDLPVSWMTPLHLSRDMCQNRFPDGAKTILYDHCTVERYNPYTQSVGGLVQRITLYADDDDNGLTTKGAKNVTEIHETYAHRKDKLIEKITYPHCVEHDNKTKIHFKFDRGLTSGLSEYVEVIGHSHEFYFFPGSRVDGLIYRQENIGAKIMEKFEKRDDHLIYRSITIDQQNPYFGANASTNTTAARQKAFCLCIGSSVDVPVSKITEKFSRHPALHAELDIIKRTHALNENLIHLSFAPCDDALLGSYQIIDKNDKLENGEIEGPSSNSRGFLSRISPQWREMNRMEQQAQIQHLLNLEKELKVKIKERENRMTLLLNELQLIQKNPPSHVLLIENVYDAAYHYADLHSNAQHQSQANVISNHNGAKAASSSHHNNGAGGMNGGVDGITSEDSDGGALNLHSSHYAPLDYLAPFLPANTNITLTRAQCEQIKAACLLALKERLIVRATIIQHHLEEEQNKLYAKQTAFKRSAAGNGQQQSGSMEANEEFQQFSQQCLFRIDILLARRTRHEQLAMQKYMELEQQLNADPRLAALHQP